MDTSTQVTIDALNVVIAQLPAHVLQNHDVINKIVSQKSVKV